MPSKSKKQRRFMAAAAHNPEFARKAGISQSVAREFHSADQRKSFGGPVKMRGPLTQATSRPVGRSAPQRLSVDLNRVDSDLNAANDSLRGVIGRLARPAPSLRTRQRTSGGSRVPYENHALSRVPRGLGPRKFADGGKVGTAVQAVRTLARRLKEALERDDKETAGRLIRQMEKLEPGSSKSLTADPSAKARSDKLATFAKGGKVRNTAKASKAVLKSLQRRLRELEGKLAYGELDENGIVKGETPEQKAAREEYDSLADEVEKKYGIRFIDEQ